MSILGDHRVLGWVEDVLASGRQVDIDALISSLEYSTDDLPPELVRLQFLALAARRQEPAPEGAAHSFEQPSAEPGADVARQAVVQVESQAPRADAKSKNTVEKKSNAKAEKHNPIDIAARFNSSHYLSISKLLSSKTDVEETEASKAALQNDDAPKKIWRVTEQPNDGPHSITANVDLISEDVEILFLVRAVGRRYFTAWIRDKMSNGSTILFDIENEKFQHIHHRISIGSPKEIISLSLEENWKLVYINYKFLPEQMSARFSIAMRKDPINSHKYEGDSKMGIELCCLAMKQR